MRRERLYMRFEGIVMSITPTNRKRIAVETDDYQKRAGMVELLWSRSSRYTRMFAVFKETAWPSHHFKTTPGSLRTDYQGNLSLTTKNHVYVFKVIRVYADNRNR